MPVTLVVGGQYGSEGKGKVVALRASKAPFPWIVRCGGPNSGHTIDFKGRSVVMRQVPSCTEPHKATFCIAAGCVVDEEILLEELNLMEIPRERIIVDPRAILVTDGDRALEDQGLKHISSTASGTGAALVRRMSRAADIKLVRDSVGLESRCTIHTVAPLLHRALAVGEVVIVEGTQGFGLSLLHGSDYPFVTSRDTSASGFASEVGLSPRSIDEIIMVVRTFPIRVGGSSGPFANETSWNDIQTSSNAPYAVPEYTSVTKKLRRVANFDLGAVRIACQYNQPTSLAVMGLDRLDYGNKGLTEFLQLTDAARAFLSKVYEATGVRVEYAGTGFGTFDVVNVPVEAFGSKYAHV
jgi:adenylosuccinate synthase